MARVARVPLVELLEGRPSEKEGQRWEEGVKSLQRRGVARRVIRWTLAVDRRRTPMGVEGRAMPWRVARRATRWLLEQDEKGTRVHSQDMGIHSQDTAIHLRLAANPRVEAVRRSIPVADTVAAAAAAVAAFDRTLPPAAARRDRNTSTWSCPRASLLDSTPCLCRRCAISACSGLRADAATVQRRREAGVAFAIVGVAGTPVADQSSRMPGEERCTWARLSLAQAPVHSSAPCEPPTAP